MDSTTRVTGALLPVQGRQRDGTRKNDPPPYSPPPAAQTGGTAHAPPPARPPAHERHGPAPRRAAPTGRAGRGDREGPPHPHARAHNTWIADPNSPPSGRAVGEGGAPDPRRPSQQKKAPPPGTPYRHPHNPKPSRGEPGPDRPPPKHARLSKGPGQDTRRGTDHVERPYQRPVPGPREVRTPHHPEGGGVDAAGARAHTRKGHAGTTRGPTGPSARNAQTAWNGVPASEGKGHPDGTARHTQAEHAGREGGNERDTTPGTGPNPPNQPRAKRTHRRGTAPAKAVVAHSATPQPLG